MDFSAATHAACSTHLASLSCPREKDRPARWRSSAIIARAVGALGADGSGWPAPGATLALGLAAPGTRHVTRLDAVVVAVRSGICEAGCSSAGRLAAALACPTARRLVIGISDGASRRRRLHRLRLRCLQVDRRGFFVLRMAGSPARCLVVATHRCRRRYPTRSDHSSGDWRLRLRSRLAGPLVGVRECLLPYRAHRCPTLDRQSVPGAHFRTARHFDSSFRYLLGCPRHCGARGRVPGAACRNTASSSSFLTWETMRGHRTGRRAFAAQRFPALVRRRFSLSRSFLCGSGSVVDHWSAARRGNCARVLNTACAISARCSCSARAAIDARRRWRR